MKMPELKGFSLVGGTALSLLYGHRKSVDLDLFSNKPFENDEIITAMKRRFRDKFIMEEKQNFDIRRSTLSIERRMK
jgi:Nucleotidyl transferase AbiEii toxin, Type IV TA system